MKELPFPSFLAECFSLSAPLSSLFLHSVPSSFPVAGGVGTQHTKKKGGEGGG